MLVGAVSTERVTMCVQTIADTRVLIKIKEFATDNIIFEKTITTEATQKNIVKVLISGLRSNTKYTYTLSGNNTEVWTEGRFITFSDKAASYKVVFGSCQETGSESVIYSQIMKESPLFYLQLGDLHYENIDDRCQIRFDSAYHKVFSSKAQAALYRNIPLVYMWDDHDFGPNNSDASNPCRTTAIQQYKNYFPHYPMAFDGETQPISQTFDVGRITYVMADMRSQKIPPSYDGCVRLTQGSNFGNETHLTWFFNTLLAAKKKGHVVFWVNSYPWINAPGGPNYKCNEKDNWGGYPEERTRIADFIKANNIPVCILSGDAHMVAMDDGSHSDYATGGGAPIRVFHAAAIDRPGSYKGGPYSQGYSWEEGQFGVIEVKDESIDDICFVWYAVNANGKPVVNQEGKEIRLEFCMTP
ncbi:MAG: alkaline phosphatase family protein [Saprospiraceae bacterium]|nr:alkaline phosphatase family protein [Saprospiraceae bacterium]